MDESGHHPKGPAEHPGEGGQGGAKQGGQLERLVAGGDVEEGTAQQHTDHHWGDVTQVLSVGGKAHDGENTA